MDIGVVWDSSVIIPLILPRSKSFRLYKRLVTANWFIAVTPAILDEVREKLQTKNSLRKWLNLADSDIQEFVETILPKLVRVYPGRLTVNRVVHDDPDDDAIIAAALESAVGYIVSEDQHLLRLKKYQEIAILSRDEFQTELDRLGVT